MPPPETEPRISSIVGCRAAATAGRRRHRSPSPDRDRHRRHHEGDGQGLKGSSLAVGCRIPANRTVRGATAGTGAAVRNVDAAEEARKAGAAIAADRVAAMMTTPWVQETERGGKDQGEAVATAQGQGGRRAGDQIPMGRVNQVAAPAAMSRPATNRRRRSSSGR